MAIENLTTFGVGCVGAAAPEIVRLYNLRLKPVFRWSWGYLAFSIPFIILGGFIAYMLEPSSPYAAFYAGVSTPVLISSIAKNTGVTASEPPTTPPNPPLPPSAPNLPGREQTRLDPKGEDQTDEINAQSYYPAPMTQAAPRKRPSLFKQFLNAL